jgi:hypothetical protein
MSMSMRGAVGEVRYGYQLAAQLSSWQLDNDRVRADVPYRNDMWLDTGTLTLKLSVGAKVWVWREVEMLSSEPFILRVIGSPEVRDA